MDLKAKEIKTVRDESGTILSTFPHYREPSPAEVATWLRQRGWITVEGKDEAGHYLVEVHTPIQNALWDTQDMGYLHKAYKVLDALAALPNALPRRKWNR